VRSTTGDRQPRAGSPNRTPLTGVGRPLELGAFARAGDRGRNGDVQLGKLLALIEQGFFGRGSRNGYRNTARAFVLPIFQGWWSSRSPLGPVALAARFQDPTWVEDQQFLGARCVRSAMSLRRGTSLHRYADAEDRPATRAGRRDVIDRVAQEGSRTSSRTSRSARRGTADPRPT